jgi:hypothetical protein
MEETKGFLMEAGGYALLKKEQEMKNRGWDQVRKIFMGPNT